MNQIFNDYASYYDLLYKDKDYARESAYVADYIRKHSPNARTILELGCGTGGHAEHLARLGFTVHGVDISERMLSVAKSRKISLPVEIADRISLECGDIRTLRTGKSYDAVVSLFHVMSYQTGNDDVKSAFKTANTHLDSEGLFLFDFWYGPGVLSLKPETRVKRLEDDNIRVTRISEPVMRFAENVVDVKYSVFIEDKKTGKISQLKEVHSMRYFSIPEINFMLTHSGFRNLHTCQWMLKNQPNSTDWSAISFATKF